MPRDVSGNYTLPLPAVVDGTTIDSTWANPTMDDIADTLTASLDRNGRGGMNVAVLNLDGDIVNPGITWGNEPQSGWYLAALNEIRGSINGADAVRFIDDTGTVAGSQKPVEVWDGLAWQKPLYGRVDESPTFGTMDVTSLQLSGNLDITGNMSIGTGLPSTAPDFIWPQIYVPGSFGFGLSVSGTNLYDWNIQNTSKPVATGEYRVNFDRDLLGYPNAIVLVESDDAGIILNWTPRNSSSINVFARNATTGALQDTLANMTFFAVLEDA